MRIRWNQDFIGQKRNESYLDARKRLLKEGGMEHASFHEKQQYLRPLRVESNYNKAADLHAKNELKAKDIARKMVEKGIKGTRVLKGNKALGVPNIHLYSNGERAYYTTGVKEDRFSIKVPYFYKWGTKGVEESKDRYHDMKELKDSVKYDKALGPLIKSLNKSHAKIGGKIHLGSKGG